MTAKAGLAAVVGCGIFALTICANGAAQQTNRPTPVRAQKVTAGNLPAKGTATVEFHDGLLHIAADNADLNSVLQKASGLLGMKLQGSTNGDRLYGEYGPGAPADVLSRVLNGLPYNYILMESPRSAVPEQLVITARAGGSAAPTPQPQPTPQANGAAPTDNPDQGDQNVQEPPQAVPEDDQQQQEQPVQEPENEQPPPPPDANAPQDNTNGTAPQTKTPEQFLDELKKLRDSSRPQ